MFLEDGCRLPAETCPSSFPLNFMELSDTEDVNDRNERLSRHQI